MHGVYPLWIQQLVKLQTTKNYVLSRQRTKKIDEFKMTVDIGSLEMFNADSDRLRRIREECAVLYT